MGCLIDNQACKKWVFVVDDHPIVRRALQLLFSLEPDLVVCGEAESEASALANMASASPDVAIVDLTLKSGSGLDLVTKLRQAYPKLQILVFSMHSENIYAERALNAGANGYLSKDEGTEKAVHAVRTLLQGRTFVSARLEERMLDQLDRLSARPSPSTSLTKRESEVLELLGRGLSSQQIARKLRLSFGTVRTHYQKLKKKLRLKSGTELVHYALHWMHDQTARQRLDLPPAKPDDGQGRIGPPTRPQGINSATSSPGISYP